MTPFQLTLHNGITAAYAVRRQCTVVGATLAYNGKDTVSTKMRFNFNCFLVHIDEGRHSCWLLQQHSLIAQGGAVQTWKCMKLEV